MRAGEFDFLSGSHWPFLRGALATSHKGVLRKSSMLKNLRALTMADQENNVAESFSLHEQSVQELVGFRH